jgi:beta-mannanase
VTAPAITPAGRSLPTVGVYIPGAAQDTTLLDTFEAVTGKRMGIVHWYQPWGYTKGWYAAPLDIAVLAAVGARGSVPMITWEAWGPINGIDPSHVANIPTGAFDDYIDSWAHGLKAYANPVYLRLFHELNNQSYPWAYGTNGNTAEDLITAWRYVHDRFARAGAANVRWVWSPNTENDLIPFSALYPGDAYVDWFGVDGYNGGTLLSWGGWLPAQQLFDRSYRSFQAINASKPVMIAEIGSVEQGGSKPLWIADLFTATIPRAFPNVRAVVWFEDDLTAQGQADWRVNSSPASLVAFSQAIAPL